MKKYISFLLLSFLFSNQVNAQDTSRKILATRTISSPKIDAILDDKVWQNVPIATDFIEHRPNFGKKEAYEKRTEVKILYDNSAIYVAAQMYDKPDSVVHEMVARDNIGNADFIGITFDTFLDKINGYGFYVTAAGVQFDAKYSNNGNNSEDANWSAVWESSAKLNENGWAVEMRIPYSALRFSSKEIQNWGLNITRKRTGVNYQSMWNPVDPRVNGFINQEGVLDGLKNIKAPLRLSFLPYLSSAYSHYPYNKPDVKNTTFNLNGGMDVKYGIDQSFTLDMTLIPDFGQVRSDNKILNLTPFEVRFDENRPFFTEGTELFNLGDLFYSRRIGISPKYFKDINPQLKEGEKIQKEPTEAKILNATKISGRTKNGLGIGLFNSITANMFSEVVDANGNIREINSQPLTNYNVLVFDQTLKNNSAISFINTNVTREGESYDANVNAFLFKLNDKKNTYYVNGSGKMSLITKENNSIQQGFSYEITSGKKSGNFIWNISQKLSDRKFDPSDMGFYTNNNFFDQGLSLQYSTYKPNKVFNALEGWYNFTHSSRFQAFDFQQVSMDGGVWMQLKNFDQGNVNFEWTSAGNDFYESRNGNVYKSPSVLGLFFNFSKNRAKAYNYGGNLSISYQNMFNGVRHNAYFYQNLRLNDKIALGLDLRYTPQYNYVNWLTSLNNTSIFSAYDRHTVENSADIKYSFSNKMEIMGRMRHYWSDRRNNAFYILKNSGDLDAYTGEPILNKDKNYNVFNIDLVYTWRFALGSELNITYKNAAETHEKFFTKQYAQNLDNIWNAAHNNSLAIKLLYFIDYLDLKKKV
ncbi:MAG: carbohydrate binding family 9 domain-containing protein [Sphingobacteriaceae bacterium]|nr:carbohydrate binding family 9 domain-containing protein [Sphingobacteriaceae bacterium]